MGNKIPKQRGSGQVGGGGRHGHGKSRSLSSDRGGRPHAGGGGGGKKGCAVITFGVFGTGAYGLFEGVRAIF